MKVLQVENGIADVGLTVEDCALLARACREVEGLHREDERVVRALGEVFRALMEAGVAQVCMQPQAKEYVEGCMVRWRKGEPVMWLLDPDPVRRNPGRVNALTLEEVE